MLGEMMASQIQRRLLEGAGGSGEDGWRGYVSSPDTGRYLIERLYRLGRSVDWRGALESSTEAALDPDAFVAALSGRD